MNNFFRPFRNRGASITDRGAQETPHNNAAARSPLDNFLGQAAQGLGQAARSVTAAAEHAAAHTGFDPDAIRRATEASLQQGNHPTQPNSGNRGGNTTVPPASKKALQDLPTVTVQPEDLVDPVNRECSICLEGHPLRTKVMRLPCSHIFHPRCVTHWLQRSCTCPVCRYELPTGNAAYERGRLQRMADRKPRFARHQLDQLSIRELKALSQRGSSKSSTSNRQTHYQAVDRADLIDYIVHQSDCIDLIAAPDPVEYTLTELRGMSIGKLKRCMNDQAGVFFDSMDVIEKNDMLRIFINSGRLVILPEGEKEDDGAEQDDVAAESVVVAVQDEDRKPAARGPLVETVSEDDSDHDDVAEEYLESSNYGRVDTTKVMEPNPDFVLLQQQQQLAATEREAAPSNELDETNAPSERGLQSVTGSASSDAASTATATVPIGSTASSQQDSEEVSANATSLDDDSWRRKRQRHLRNETAVTSDASDSSSLDDTYSATLEQVTPVPQDSLEVYTQEADDAAFRARFQRMSVSALRELARQASVDLSDCIERHEMIDRLVSSNSSQHESTASNGDDTTNGRTISSTTWEEWGVSEIFSLARQVDVDLSDCQDRDEMICTLAEAIRDRPHVAHYLKALTPLARLTVPQLRAVAREWRVDVSDCLEKGDMFHRLVSAGGPPAL